ncbi:MAG TPA: hypothetical protein QGH10_17285 [Armatimonadota bacterium]|nr:hypothetical protein [Armatimonadota bacterium]
MKPSLPLSITALLTVSLATLAAPDAGADTWGFVRSFAGSNIVLDDGQLVRLTPGTRIIRADGSAATRADIARTSKVEVTFAADGGVAQVQVYAPGAIPEVHLSNLPPVRGSAYVTEVGVAGKTYSRALAALRATYARPATYTQLRTGIHYDPKGIAGAPAAARFMLKDSFGDVLVDRVLATGASATLNMGLDAQATDRITLEVAPAGEGSLPQEACLWLDPRMTVGQLLPAPLGLTAGAPKRLADALIQKLGETKLGPMAVCDFAPIRGRGDNYMMRDLSEDLMVLLMGQTPVAGAYRKALAPGVLIADADKKAIQTVGATTVLTGSVNWRPEGIVVNAIIVNVEDGQLIASASILD